MKSLKVHFVGIKGVGQAALSIIAKEAGFKVTGSDIDEEFITDEPLKRAQITPLIGFSKDHITYDLDFVVTTGAHLGFDNIEVKEAKKKGIKVISKGEAVGLFMDGEIFGRKTQGISVAGSHGKTTITAMIATILAKNNLDPSFVVGTGLVPSLGNSGHFGKGSWFVAEADEYATEPKYDKTPQFLWQHPKIAVFTNIELDHPDVYKNVERIREAFLKFADKLAKDSVLVANADDPQVRLLLKKFKGKYITYGFSPMNDFVLKNVKIEGTQTFFWAESKNLSLGEFALNIPGEHNALNALGASVVALEAGIPLAKIKRALVDFTGTKRRFEFVGVLEGGALLYDDYAHHPSEIKQTLKTFRQSFPKKNLVCIFQPHTYSRTKKLLEQFAGSFRDADTVIFIDIFPSQREKKDKSVSSQILAQKTANFHKNSLFLPKLSDVVEYVKHSNFDKDTILLSMGAGDVYKIAKMLDLKTKDR